MQGRTRGGTVLTLLLVAFAVGVAMVIAYRHWPRGPVAVPRSTDGHGMVVRFIPYPPGDICLNSPIGKRSTLVVTDESGHQLATARFKLTRGAGTCDFTAVVQSVPDAALRYTLIGDGTVLANVPRSEMLRTGWRVTIHATE